MFEFLFKYPLAAFQKGELVLLGAGPRWLLALLILLAAVGLAVLVWARARQRNIRAGTLWLLQAMTAAVLLLLLWQPALVVNELEPRQNIIAILVDESRSMSQKDDGRTSRASAAVAALRSGVLTQLQKRFQTRLYTFDATLKRSADPQSMGPPIAPATHIGASLKQLLTQMEGLPLRRGGASQRWRRQRGRC